MTESNSDNAVARFFGYALMVIGGLILVLSGLCTTLGLVFAVPALFVDASLEARTGPLELVAAFGLLPILVSLAVFFVGRLLVRNNTPSPVKGPPGRMLDLSGGEPPSD